MPSSAVLTFADPYEFQSAVRAASMTMLITAAGEYHAELTRIDLHKLWMQRGQASLPAVNHSALSKTRSSLFFPARMNQPAMLHTGLEVRPGDMMVTSLGAEHYHRFAAGAHWAAMSLTVEDLAEAGRALAGDDLAAPAVTRLIRPPAHVIGRLLRLHEAAARLAATVPDVLAHPEVARAIEQELIRAMVACLLEGVTLDRGTLRDLRLPVMRRFERVLAQNQNRPLYVAEICAAIGVADRTLRLRCMEELGMSPHRYLWLRRMHLARRALAQADAVKNSVTEIAMNHGFGELGRFSVGYHRLFGETPSSTLRRTPGEAPALNNPMAPPLQPAFSL